MNTVGIQIPDKSGIQMVGFWLEPGNPNIGPFEYRTNL
jgi:hypothetical protein